MVASTYAIRAAIFGRDPAHYSGSEGGNLRQPFARIRCGLLRQSHRLHGAGGVTPKGGGVGDGSPAVVPKGERGARTARDGWRKWLCSLSFRSAFLFCLTFRH